MDYLCKIVGRKGSKGHYSTGGEDEEIPGHSFLSRLTPLAVAAMGLQGCATLAFYTSLSTSRFAIVLRGTLSQDDIVDAGSLLGQVRDLELLTMIIDGIYYANVSIRSRGVTMYEY